ncbi:hypothetical protein [Streptomyces sp. NPDC056512]|uniref:hypothetical protein n=1 Tax=Streptomyces sp. NPDC056512 TaxID=3345846 RepID=UPI0036CF72DF
MSYHEGNPWKEPQRIPRTNHHIVIGGLVTIAVVVVLAVLEIEAAAAIVGLALLTALALSIGSRADKHHGSHA